MKTPPFSDLPVYPRLQPLYPNRCSDSKASLDKMLLVLKGEFHKSDNSGKTGDDNHFYKKHGGR